MGGSQNPSFFNQGAPTKVKPRWLYQSSLVFNFSWQNISAMNNTPRSFNFITNWICAYSDKKHKIKDVFHHSFYNEVIALQGLLKIFFNIHFIQCFISNKLSMYVQFMTSVATLWWNHFWRNGVQGIGWDDALFPSITLLINCKFWVALLISEPDFGSTKLYYQHFYLYVDLHVWHNEKLVPIPKKHFHVAKI